MENVVDGARQTNRNTQSSKRAETHAVQRGQGDAVQRKRKNEEHIMMHASCDQIGKKKTVLAVTHQEPLNQILPENSTYQCS